MIITVQNKYTGETPYPDTLEFYNLSLSDLDDLISICEKSRKEIHISFESDINVGNKEE